MIGKLGRQVWELIKFVAIVLIVVIPIRAYIAQPFIVSGASMEPTFHNREYLIIDEISYQFREPERGEVVVFRYPEDPDKHFIKRIIGLPGETITVDNGVVTIARGDEIISIQEPYIKEPFGGHHQATLGEGEYFVMGDNRLYSLDSRAWGPLPAQLITGRVLVRLFPFNEVGLFPGSFDYATP